MIGRRDLITLLGGAVAWPLAAQAQPGGKPVIGYLGPVSAETFTDLMSQFRRGLREAGIADSHSIPIEYRWRAADMEWPVLAAGLVERKVDVVATAGDAATRAVKAATTAIPIVFVLGSDPVEAGLVASLSRPGGNLTGATTLNLELSAKRVEVVRELLPKAAHVVLLVNPSSVATAEALIRETKAAAVRYELRISVLRASTDHEIETAFAALQELRADTLLISPDAFLNTRGGKLGGLAVRHAIPAIAPTPAFASAGGLLAFGSSMPELYRLQGAYVGRILQGQRPADLPVQQATKIELVINLKTAKALGLDVPPTLIARADEVIE